MHSPGFDPLHCKEEEEKEGWGEVKKKGKRKKEKILLDILDA
jgi:hypothetical protein